MADTKVSKNKWVLFLVMMSGIVLGGFIGSLASHVSFLSWMDFGYEFGLDEPIVLNLVILVITFGLKIKISIASILGMILSIFIYKKM